MKDIILDQVEEHEIYTTIQKSHRDINDFNDGDLGERIEEYRYYNLIQNFDLTLLNKDEWYVDDDLVKEYELMIEKDGIANMPTIVISDQNSIIDGIHRANALLNKGIKNIDIYIGSNKKINLDHTFENMVKTSFSDWDEYDIKQSFSNFKGIMKNHILMYSGKENVEKSYSNWEKSIKDAFNNGANIERVVFLDNINNLDLDNFNESTSWTLLNLIKSHLISDLKYISLNMGTSKESDHAYIFKAQCPPRNFNLNSVPIPNERDELEINIINYDLLNQIKIYRVENNQEIEIGILDIQNKCINLISDNLISLDNTLCNLSSPANKSINPKKSRITP
jgi:hypothetical protein